MMKKDKCLVISNNELPVLSKENIKQTVFLLSDQ